MSNGLIDSHEFTADIKSWLSIICARIFPYTHDKKVTLDRALIITAIIDGIEVNVGRLIVDQMAELAQGRVKSIVLLSLVTHICYYVWVVK